MLNELRMKQEDYDKLHDYADSLKKEKESAIENCDEERIQNHREF